MMYEEIVKNIRIYNRANQIIKNEIKELKVWGIRIVYTFYSITSL